MALDMKKMDILKEKLVNCKNFNEVFNYFYDHFGENKEFVHAGREVKYAELKQVLIKVGQLTIRNLNAKPSRFFIIRVKSHHFYHGGFHLDRKLVNFIFFKDIDKGMITISSFPVSSEVLFGRFSLAKFKDDISQVSLN